MCFCYSEKKQSWRNEAVMTFHIQGPVLQEKEGPLLTRPELWNKARPEDATIGDFHPVHILIVLSCDGGNGSPRLEA